MSSYLLSLLTKQARSSDFAALLKRFDHDWLIWEPGPWRPPQASRATLVIPVAPATPERTPGPAAKPPSGEALGLSLKLAAGKDAVVVGRAQDCDIAISDATVSSKHLLFMRGTTGWTVRDAKSSNGSWLDGARLEPGLPRALSDGAQLRAGNVYLTFHQPGGLYVRLRTG